MKKTQKIFALLLAVMMIFSCFSMVVMAEETEMITVISATEISKNEYVIEFSAPVHFHNIGTIFRRQTGYSNGTEQQYDKTVEYIGETSDVGGVTYSAKVKITFKDDVSSKFNQGRYGITLAEYNYGSTTEHLGALSDKIVTGANGELVKANFTNTEAVPLDFVWIPTASLDPNGTYGIRLVNGYEEDIKLLSVEVSEDFSTYTCKFSAPVTIADKSRIWLRPDDPNGANGQVNPKTVEYLGETVTFVNGSGESVTTYVFSDTVKLTFDPDGGEYGGKTIRESSQNFTKYGLDFVEYGLENGNANFISGGVIYGLNGRVVKSNLYESGENRDFLWAPTFNADTRFAYKTHLGFGAPYVVSATQLASTTTVRVVFSEPVAYKGSNWRVIMRNHPESSTQANLLTPTTVIGGETVTVGGVTYGTQHDFTFNAFPESFSDGAYGITFVEYDAGDVLDGIVTPQYICDVDGHGLMGTYSNTHDFTWIPTDAEDPDNVYPIHLEHEKLPERIEVATYDELKAAVNRWVGQTIYVTEDIVANEGITYEYDEQTGKVLVVDNDGGVVAAYGTGAKGTTAGQLIEGSIEGLEVWEPFTAKNNVIDFQGHKVAGWVLGLVPVSASTSRSGLFDVIEMTATVKNVNIENVFSCVTGTTGARIGALVAENKGIVENVQVKDAVFIVADSMHNNVGVAIGYMNSTKAAQVENFNPTVYNVTTDGYIFNSYLPEGNHYPCVGGVVGKSNGGKIMNCVNYAQIYQFGTRTNASYGTGGIVGLVETAAGGPFSATTDFSKKTLENIYVVNNANYGKIEVFNGMSAAGIIGYIDAIWSAGSSITVANNFNGAKIVGGTGGIVAKSQSVSSLGSCTIVYEFNFDDITNGNIFNKLSVSFVPNVVRLSSQSDALENLNRNVGKYQAVNGEEAAKAWAWEEVDGIILPVVTATVGDVKDATPVTLPEYTFDPETEIGILGAKLVSPYVIEVTFSEPVVPGSIYGGIRYVDLSTGVPQLIYADFDGNGSSDPAQFDRAGTVWTEGNKAYFSIQKERATAESNDILDMVSGAGFGDKVSGHDVAFVIEGVPVKDSESGALIEGSNEVGYIDTITSADGTKKLKASPGSSNVQGTYDGAYVFIENPYEDGDFINPEESDEYVVLKGAELAGPHSLKLSFSEPVELIEGTKAWLSVRYCKYAADGYTPNYMMESGNACQVGLTITSDNFLCNEDGSYVVNFGEDVDVRALVNGEAWEGVEAILISIEQLPAQIEGYNGSIGFIDNIVSLDGNRMLAASPAKYDVTKNNAGEYGAYDGAYAEIAAHECEYDIVGGDEDYHWLECICGTVDEDSIEDHDFIPFGYDEENHWLECECGAKFEVTSHDYTELKHDEENHWFECECGAKGEKTPHDLSELSHRFEGHCDMCAECGYEDETSLEPHEYNTPNYDSEEHWFECECGALNGVERHEYGDGNTCECGNTKYVVGDLNGDEKKDADDAIYLLYSVFFGEDEYTLNQPIDFNNDTKADADDAIYLLYNAFFGDDEYPLFPERDSEEE